MRPYGSAASLSGGGAKIIFILDYAAIHILRWVDLPHPSNVAILRLRYDMMKINVAIKAEEDRGFSWFGRLSFAGSLGSDYALRFT